MKKCGVYTITNTINNKIYVGSTTRLFCQRWGEHKVQLRNSKHHNIHLQRAWDKYGEYNFLFEVLEIVIEPKHLLSVEQYWMNMLNSYKIGYNRTSIAGNSYGSKRTLEQCKAQSLLGNWRKANSAWKGSTHTEKTKKIIREKRATQIMGIHTLERREAQSIRAKAVLKGNKNRMKYFNIIATKSNKELKFDDMRKAMQYFNLKTSGSIGRVIRKERTHWHGWKFTCDEMT